MAKINLWRDETINEYYYIGGLSDEQVQKLLALKKVNPNKGLDFLTDIVYDISDEDVKRLIESGKRYSELFNSEPPKGKLRPYQTVNVAYGYYAKKALLGDSYGLGKTYLIGGIINLLKRDMGDDLGKILVLGEKNTVYQLRDSIVKTTGLKTIVTTGERDVVLETLDNISDCDVVIGTHSVLNSSQFTADAIYNRHFNVLFVDESSAFKSPKSDAASKLLEFSKLVEYMFELNATPIELELMDLYTQLYLLDHKLLPAKTTFEKEYYKYDYSKFVPTRMGCKEGMEEKARIRMSLRYNGYTRKQLFGYDVTDGNDVHVCFVEKSREQRYLLNQKFMWQLVLDAPIYVDKFFDINEHSVPKMGCLMGLARSVLKGKKTLIYCKYKRMHTHLKYRLEELGYKVKIINGETDSETRNDIKNDFNDGDTDIIVSSLKRGLDLTNGDVCVMYTLETNPQKMKQIEGRIMRSMKPVGKEFYIILTEKSEETRKIKGIMKSRDDTAKKVVNLDDGILKECIRQVLEHEKNYIKKK